MDSNFFTVLLANYWRIVIIRGFLFFFFGRLIYKFLNDQRRKRKTWRRHRKDVLGLLKQDNCVEEYKIKQSNLLAA